MVKSAQAGRIKAYARLQSRSESLKRALEAWKAQEEGLYVGEKKSVRKLAREFGVPQQTLSDHVNNKHRPQKEFLESLQKLTVMQEKALVELLQQLDEGAMPASRADIEMRTPMPFSIGQSEEGSSSSESDG